MTVKPWDAVDQLVLAVGGRDEQIRETVSRLGAGRVMDILAAEVHTRCEPPAHPRQAAMGLRIDWEGESGRYTIRFDDGEASLQQGASPDILAEIGYSLVDLVRLLYPTRPGYRPTSRELGTVAWPWQRGQGDVDPAQLMKQVEHNEIDPEQMAASTYRRMADLSRCVRAFTRACTGGTDRLDDLATRYGADKCGAVHWYTPHYERHLGILRYDPVRVLEIGIGGYSFKTLGGESLYMWQRFFPRGIIYGLDIFDKPAVVGPRIQTLRGDQNDPGFLQKIADTAGPFDVIIDDGSHVNEHVRTSFEALFRHVRPGGYYVIEDTYTSYWPELGGELPPGSARTTLGMVKDLIDSIHAREYTDEDEQTPARELPAEISVYRNIVFLRKAAVDEPAIPPRIRFGAALLQQRM